jgi:hypothetical protein
MALWIDFHLTNLPGDNSAPGQEYFLTFTSLAIYIYLGTMTAGAVDLRGRSAWLQDKHAYAVLR